MGEDMYSLLEKIYRLVNNNRPYPSYQYDLHSLFELSSSDDVTIDDAQHRHRISRS